MFGKRRRKVDPEVARLSIHSLYMAGLMAAKGGANVQAAFGKEDPEEYLRNRQRSVAFYHFINTNFLPDEGFANTGQDSVNIPDSLVEPVLKIAEKWVEGKTVSLTTLDSNDGQRFDLIDKWMENAFEQLLRPVLSDYHAERTKRDAWDAKVDLMTLYPDETEFLKFLRQRGPDPALWHSVVMQTDPDGRDELYAWIASQPDCDKGTAIQIFHYSHGDEALKHRDETSFLESYRSTMYKTAKLIADRVEHNGFRTWRYAANDVSASVSLQSYVKLEELATQKYGRPYFHVSEDFFDTRSREEPNTKYKYSDF